MRDLNISTYIFSANYSYNPHCINNTKTEMTENCTLRFNSRGGGGSK